MVHIENNMAINYIASLKFKQIKNCVVWMLVISESRWNAIY